MSIFKSARAYLRSPHERERNEGYARETREATLFRLAGGKVFERRQAMDWLQTNVDEGRGELEAQQAREREVEAADMSCRIAFLVEIA
jgi:hypothetical protein